MLNNKRIAFVLTLIVLSACIVSCRNESNSQTKNSTINATSSNVLATDNATVCSVELIVESEDNVYFGTYPVDVIVDNSETLTTIYDGKTEEISLNLTNGAHIIKFQRNDESDFYTEVTANITGDCTLKYYIDCHSKVGGGIKVKLDEVSENTKEETTQASEITTQAEETEVTETEESIQTTTEIVTETENNSIYDIAFKIKNKEYSVYYVIDFDSKIARSFTTNDKSVCYGTITGDLDGIIDIYYPGEGMEYHEYLREKKKGDDSIILEASGYDPYFQYPIEMKKCDVSEAEAVLNQEGYHDMNS